MDMPWILNALLVISLILAMNFFVRRAIKKSQLHRENITNKGTSVNLTILSMKQSGVFINNCPVLLLKLRVEDVATGDNWVIDEFKETALLIALNDYQSGNVYQGKLDRNKSEIIFVRDPGGKPILLDRK
ncbi:MULTISPECIES: hypothetical protein [Erwinia]|uniref:hypothetical protein n=1 Tax=Erwinia TaxID=551 RepID=UPI0010615741|nr:hypothetical protein [Erwinia aphidicola]MCP2231903.1 hypothetical protein [Erwinia aphidicola]